MSIDSQDAGSHRKVLVVDDDQKLRIILKAALKRDGYGIEEAPDGEQALQKIRDQGDIDLVISDWMMPVKDGVTFLKELRADPKYNKLFFILLTAKTESDDQSEGFTLGADDYITKPYVIKDVLQRVKAGFRMIDLNKQLGQAIAQKDDVLGVVAHDLRNPLTVIRGVVDLFDKGIIKSLDEDAFKFLGSVDKQCEVMLNLINDLLDMTRMEGGQVSLKKASADVRELFVERCAFNDVIAQKKDISLKQDFASDLGEAMIDARRLGAVMDNLISNAVKYSKRDSQVEVKAEKKDGQIFVSVKDQGLGIAPEEMANLFQKFGRISTRPTEGESSTGLGLAIVRKIVEDHGGQVRAESKQGEGSTFYFNFPV